MSRPTFAVAVIFNIAEGHDDAFFQRVKQQACDSIEKEEWCHQFDVCRDAKDPRRFFLFETYDDAAAFEKHRSTPHFADFRDTIGDWVQSKELNTWEITTL